jgi:hypothetical protein
MTNRTKTQEEEILNHLLVSIVIANSGTVTSNDKVSLLQSWLDSLSAVVITKVNYLKFEGGRINFPSVLLTEYRMVFDIQVNQGVTGVWLSQDNNISNYINFSSTSVSIKPEGKSPTTLSQGSSAIPLFDNRVTFDVDVKTTGTTIVITEPLSTRTMTSALDLTGLDFTQIFRRGDTGAYIDGELYGLSIYDGEGALINDYDMSGTGSILVDTVGGRDGTISASGVTWEVLQPTPATQPNLNFPLLTQTALPNGAQGQNPSGGFTNTGLDYIPPNAQYTSGAWLVGNDGRATTTSSPNLSSLVILSADFSTILDEWDMSGATFSNGETIQGVAVADDGSYYAASGRGTGLILHIDSADGTKLGEIAAAGVNGIAFDSQRNGLWYKGGDETVRFYDLTTSAVTDQMRVEKSTDMLGITSNGYLYGSYGDNGVDGKVRFYDTVSKAAFAETTGLENCQASEGVYYDPVTSVLTMMCDGGFHAEASPALSLGLTYSGSLLDLTPV